MTWSTVTEYLCHRLPRICSVCRIVLTPISSPLPPPITEVLIRVIRWVLLVEQELISLPEHLSSSHFCEVHVTQFLVFCVVFWRSLFVFSVLYNDHEKKLGSSGSRTRDLSHPKRESYH